MKRLDCDQPSRTSFIGCGSTVTISVRYHPTFPGRKRQRDVVLLPERRRARVPESRQAVSRSDLRAHIPALRAAARDLAVGPPDLADELVRDAIAAALVGWDQRQPGVD